MLSDSPDCVLGVDLKGGDRGRLEGGQGRREGGGRAVHGRRVESHSRPIPAPTRSFTPPKTNDPRAPYNPATAVIKQSHIPPSTMSILPFSMTHSTEDMSPSIYTITRCLVQRESKREHNTPAARGANRIITTYRL